MKIKQLIEIENVRKANGALSTLLERTKSENIGLGLFYGRPGLGKTRWAFKTAITNGYVYIRMIENITLKTFLKDLLIAIKYTDCSTDQLKYTAKQLYDEVLEVLQTVPNVVVFIDEIDYAFKNKRILATIRDFADMSFASFVLIGMQESKLMLKKLNSHYFDRCNGFCEFRALSIEDTTLFLNSICEITLDKDIIDFIHTKANGTMRLITKYIDVIEKIARKLKKDELAFKEIREILTRIEG